jgi:hypothetical protein
MLRALLRRAAARQRARLASRRPGRGRARHAAPGRSSSIRDAVELQVEAVLRVPEGRLPLRAARVPAAAGGERRRTCAAAACGRAAAVRCAPGGWMRRPAPSCACATAASCPRSSRRATTARCCRRCRRWPRPRAVSSPAGSGWYPRPAELFAYEVDLVVRKAASRRWSPDGWSTSSALPRRASRLPRALRLSTASGRRHRPDGRALGGARTPRHPGRRLGRCACAPTFPPRSTPRPGWPRPISPTASATSSATRRRSAPIPSPSSRWWRARCRPASACPR